MFTDISEYTQHNPEWIGSVDLLVKPPTREELLEEHPECAVDISDLGGDYRKAHYMMMRRNGETHNMSAMAASSRAPKCVTDREFFEGIGSIHDQFDADTPRGRIQMEKVLGSRRQMAIPQAETMSIALTWPAIRETPKPMFLRPEAGTTSGGSVSSEDRLVTDM